MIDFEAIFSILLIIGNTANLYKNVQSRDTLGVIMSGSLMILWVLWATEVTGLYFRF